MARESLPDAIAFEQSPGGSQGVVLADIQETGIPAEGTGSAKALGPERACVWILRTSEG